MRSLIPALGPGVLGLKHKLSLLPHNSKSVSGGNVTFRLKPGLKGEPAAEFLAGIDLLGDSGPAVALPLLLGLTGPAGTAAAGCRWDRWLAEPPEKLVLGLGSDTESPAAASGRL